MAKQASIKGGKGFTMIWSTGNILQEKRSTIVDTSEPWLQKDKIRQFNISYKQYIVFYTYIGSLQLSKTKCGPLVEQNL